MTTSTFTLTPDQVRQFDEQGYLIVRQLLTANEVKAIRDRFDQIGQAGKPMPGWEPDLTPAPGIAAPGIAAPGIPASGTTDKPADVLKRYPRMMMPHRWDDLSLQLLLDPRVRDVLAALLREEPVAAQTMYYFKPSGARGQAFHQDNFYLSVKPGTCIAAWVAIDPSMPENGGLSVVPGSHRLDITCPESADENESFTTNLVRPPEGMTPMPVYLEPGDVLFFGGSMIHGSQPNRSNIWRRSFISHYIPTSSIAVSHWYFPLLKFDGSVAEYQGNQDGGPCGTEFKPTTAAQAAAP